MTAIIMLLGPESGITRKPCLWAMATTLAPGSATAGQPASLMTPMDVPLRKGCKYCANKCSSACLPIS